MDLESAQIVDIYASAFLKGHSLAASLLSLWAGQAESAWEINAPVADLRQQQMVISE